MDIPSGKKLVAVLAAVGASTGGAAAVVWHVAVADPQELGVTNIRPSWFPMTLYLVAAGLAVGLVVASFLVDSGLRIVQDRQRSRVHLFALLIVVGAALGAGSALAWTHWPPEPTEAVSNWSWAHPLSIEINSPPAADFPSERFGIATGGISGMTTNSDDTYTQNLYRFVTTEDTSFHPTIGNPWLVFPIGGVAIAALAALTLSLRDFRLTVVSRSDQGAV
ncbi:hypothetical protein [Rhodococcus sp. (in: high G+C Gram-positive bacteria)]|uniref:hypothetical protein n=1 Tax=unclassified Rhodococcus (in: high G+C Gram-positive bacteria) TaxID=192944 RepID=UPI002AD96AB1|nr:hypothetical protein [Rhodococcus sp. (in: high G+C Gram-positive bacteria)]